MTRSRQTADWGSRAGLAKVVPSSITVGSGTGSADSLGTVTYSGASSVSLNGCFTSTYTNYRLVVNVDSASTDSAIIYARMRASGTDATTVNYGWALIKNSYTTSSVADGATQNAWIIGNTGVATSHFVVDMLYPNTTERSQFSGNAVQTGDVWWTGGTHSVLSAYDGFTFFLSSGTLTGTVSVYGYTK